ncbi:DUF1902 domain-containing protein [Enterovirga aerilata]|uniref:DUF1902 domain-containing protein n=1 Tax=Enterovirga aerilata TaxID=2730920 RepID=A0A849IFQ7_9HYPH|nr:DUF1902 domain-containing protein [Enterovirga sp. DB1703]NNM74797.1 DUF1902 domain-containing protein [Enterovirga sp. DB1703]
MDNSVEVEWYGEASVWIAASPEIGLFTEAETLDELRRKVPIIASDLLDDKIPQGTRLHLELRVRLDEVLPAAA